MNLTRIIDKADFIERHLKDSLQLFPHIPEGAIHMIDVGTGGGFPGLPIWIARPDLSLTLLDATQKKVKAVQTIASRLKEQFPNHLKSLPLCVHERAEVIGQDSNYREQFDMVVSRAVAALPTLLELCIPLVKTSGCFIAMKGQKYHIEMQDIERVAGLLGASFTEKKHYQLYNQQEYVLLFFEKVEQTSLNYPRRSGVPSKKPL